MRPALLLTLLLALVATPALAASDLKGDRDGVRAAMARVDCAGGAELLVGLNMTFAPAVDLDAAARERQSEAIAQRIDALRPALRALDAEIVQRFEGRPALLVAADAGGLRWLAASDLVGSLYLVRTRHDIEVHVLRHVAQRDGVIRVIATTLDGETDAALAALGSAGVEVASRLETVPQAALRLTAPALDRLLAIPSVCAVVEDRLGFGN
ncbi:MAG: hypothetical protein RIM84_08470 [Alphaproteobacteria bacterium]